VSASDTNKTARKNLLELKSPPKAPPRALEHMRSVVLAVSLAIHLVSQITWLDAIPAESGRCDQQLTGFGTTPPELTNYLVETTDRAVHGSGLGIGGPGVTPP
jgi:hypothetical protein